MSLFLYPPLLLHACLSSVIESKYGFGVFLKSRDCKYLLEEAGLGVRGLAPAAAEGLGDNGRRKVAQKQRECGKGQVWLKSLSISCCNLENG